MEVDIRESIKGGCSDKQYHLTLSEEEIKDLTSILSTVAGCSWVYQYLGDVEGMWEDKDLEDRFDIDFDFMGCGDGKLDLSGTGLRKKGT